MKDIPGYPDYELRGRAGSQEVVHKSSGVVFGKEKDGRWENEDDEGGTITANSPEELLTSNATSTRNFDKSRGFTQ